MELYGRSWTRRELEERIGRLEQVGGITRVARRDGAEDGVEQLLVRTGAGLDYRLTPSRALDVDLAQFGGVPLCWLGPSGLPHPAFYDSSGLNWLRTAAGGLMMTCGLTQVGPPCNDAGVELGLHGRIHHQPARLRSVEERWENEGFTLAAAAESRLAALFGENLELYRRVSSRLGENALEIEDAVTNRGFEPAPHMILYHFNFGFPLVDEHCELSFPSRNVQPRSEDVPLEGYDRWEAPVRGYEERVYFHSDLQGDARGWAAASVRQPVFPLAGEARPVTVELRWDTATLPRMTEWKMCGQGAHVLGIEPTNCIGNGRAAARESGALRMLEPGETVNYRLRLAVSVG